MYINKMYIDKMKLKKNIYSKPKQIYYDNIFSPIRKYNHMFTELLSNCHGDDKNIMVSELDINVDDSQVENEEEVEQNKKEEIIKNPKPKNEFKYELKENIMKLLENKKQNITFSKTKDNDNNKDFIPKAKPSLNLTSLTPTNDCFKTLNVNKNNDGKVNKKNYLIKINKKQIIKKKSMINNKRKDIFLKNSNNKFGKTMAKFNSNIYKKIKKNNILLNQQKSLLITEVKKNKNVQSFINENKKISNTINQTTYKRNSFKNSMLRNTFKHLTNHKILNTISKSKEKKEKDFLNKQLLSLYIKKYSLTDNNYNTSKNILHEKHDIGNNNKPMKKIIPNKFRNLTLKEIKLLNNLNLTKSYCSSFLNTTNINEKEKNLSTIIYEKKRLKSPISKIESKIQVRKNWENSIKKKPINIVNININRNNNFIMNFNSNDNVHNKKINTSIKKDGGKIRKFFSFQNFFNLGESYKKESYKKISKEKQSLNKNKKSIPFAGKTERNKIKA